MVGIYFKKNHPVHMDMSDWLENYCKDDSGCRLWKWIMHPENAGVWGILLPDKETLIAFKLTFPIQSLGEFENDETPEHFAARQFELSWG
jgi:hypothetical protein